MKYSYLRCIASAMAAITAVLLMVFAAGCTAGAPTMDSVATETVSHGDVAGQPSVFVGPRAISELWYIGLESIDFRLLRAQLDVDLANQPGLTNYELWQCFQVCDDEQGANAAYLPWSASYASLDYNGLANAIYDAVEASGRDYVRWDDLVAN